MYQLPPTEMTDDDTFLLVRCRQPYFKQREDELEMRAHDYILVLSQEVETWWIGLNLHTNDKGWFPKDFVKQVGQYPKTSLPKLQQEIQAKSQMKAHTRPKRNPYAMMVEVLFDYDPQDDDELQLVTGDIIGVMKEIEGWYQGEKDGQQGIFPANFVRVLTDEEVSKLYATAPRSSAHGAHSPPILDSQSGEGSGSDSSEFVPRPPADNRLSGVVNAFPLPGKSQNTPLPLPPAAAPPPDPLPPVEAAPSKAPTPRRQSIPPVPHYSSAPLPPLPNPAPIPPVPRSSSHQEPPPVPSSTSGDVHPPTAAAPSASVASRV
ncbi:hypothetical protein BJ085DRAFT_36703, partial [Dimargaris cristalligena]